MKQVILLMTDTTRKDMLGCYGNPDMKTPHLDHLAQEGLRYENAYSCQPVCGPARSAIFTGQMPHSNGVVANSIALGDNIHTVGERLSDQGVHCAYIGKWHLDGADYFGNGVCPDGWDPKWWYDMRCYLEELTPEERTFSRKSANTYDPGLTADFTYAWRCSTRAIDFLKENKDTDFFLTVSYDEPHGPSLCPAPYNRMYDGYLMPDSENFADDLSKKPIMQQLWAKDALHADPETLRAPTEAKARFLGCNTFVDEQIGRVLEVIDRDFPDALVIFTSDHGCMLGNHRLQQKNSCVYREAANIPLLIRGGAKGVVTAPASHLDLTPTILDYYGVERPPVVEGKSMLEQIYHPETEIRDASFVEFTRYEVDHDGFGGLQMMRGIVTERYKLAIHVLDTDELYDTQEDPAEVHNLINDPAMAQIRNDLHDRLLAWMDESRDPYRGYYWACRPWRPEMAPTWENSGFTRQREESEFYEPRQMNYDTGLPMEEAIRQKKLKKFAGAK